MRSLLILGVILSACTPYAAPSPTSEATPTPKLRAPAPTPNASSAGPNSVPTPTASPPPPFAISLPDTPVSRDDPFHLRRTGEIPPDFALIATDGYDVRGYRVWLVDLAAKSPPHDLLTYTAYSGGVAITRDGHTVVVAAGDKWGQSLFIGDVTTGAIRTIDHGDINRRPSYPAITRDGTRIAYMISQDRWATQIWGGRLPDGPFVPLVIAPRGQFFGYGPSFSPDGRFLSYALDGRGQVLDLRTDLIYDVGPIYDVYNIRWHPTRPLLVVGSRWLPEEGWSVTVFDAEHATFAQVVRSASGHGAVIDWNASGDGVYTWEAEDCDLRTGCARGWVRLHLLSGATDTVSDRKLSGQLFVRGDGALLTIAWNDGDPLVPLISYPSGETLFSFCKRGGVAPSCAGFG